MSEKRGYVRENILRVLLNNPEGNLTKYRVAKLSGANISWVIETLRNLEKANLINGTTVKDYIGLISLWKEWRMEPRKKEYMIKKPLEVLQSSKLKYALTTYQAENIVQNYLFPSRIDFYIDPKDEKKWHIILSKEGLVGKGNTRMLIPDDDHVLHTSTKVKGMHIVSIPQLIVDLLSEGGVCIEAAEKLMERQRK